MNKKYSNKEVKKILKRDIEMPVVVTEQLMSTLEGVCGEYEPEKIHTCVKKYKRVMKYKQIAAIFAVICILSCGAVATAVGMTKWNEIAKTIWIADNELQNEMSEKGVARIPDISATDNGVTISVEQIVTDGLSEYVLFKMEGPEAFEIPENFSFHDFTVQTDGTIEEGVIDAACYQTVLKRESETEEKINPEKNIIYFQMHLDLEKPNVLQGKTLDINFYNMVVYEMEQIKTEKAETEKELLKGTWKISISPEMQEYAMSMTEQFDQKMEMGDKVSIEKVILSPMNLQVELSYMDCIPEEYISPYEEPYKILPRIKKMILLNGSELEMTVPTICEYGIYPDKETEKKLENVHLKKAISDIYSACKDWKINLGIDYTDMTNTNTENEEPQMINPEDVKSIVLEYQGKEYEYSIHK